MTATRDVEQREPRTDEIRQILKEFKEQHTEEFEFARTLFSVLVDPDAYYRDDLSDDEACNVNSIFSEWCLFDFKLPSGLSLIEEAALDDPSISQFAHTQFYSRFWVTKQDNKRGIIRLRDVETRDEFEVWDERAAARRVWRRGTLGVRIARVGDVWVSAGTTSLHDNAPSKPRSAKLGARRDHEGDPWLFLRDAEAVVGHNGIFHDSLLSVGPIE